MKKILLLAVSASLLGFAASCEKADVLKPTNIEKDWSKNIDLSNDYVKQIYEQTGVAILTEFNDELDVYYQGSEYGTLNSVSITHIESHKDEAIEWLKTNILDCFSTECMKKYFPRRIFLCNSLKISGSEPANVGAWIREMRYTNNGYGATGAQHAFPFTQGLAICVNVDELLTGGSAIDYATAYRKDIMTLICMELFMNNDWLKDIDGDDEIFPDEVVARYGHTVLDKYTTNTMDSHRDITEKGMYRMKYGYSAMDRTHGDPYTMNDWRYMTLSGYFAFGFPDNAQTDNKASSSKFVWPGKETELTSTYYDDGNGGYTAKTSIKFKVNGYATISDYNRSSKNLQAPMGPYRDARDLIGAITDVNDVKLTVYGPLLISRLCAMSDYFLSQGIDFKKFNPSVVKMYEMN